MSLSALLKNEFTFRANRETGYKRPSVEVEFSVPTAEGLIEVLKNEEDPAHELVLSTVHGLITSYIRSAYIDSNEDFDQETCAALDAEGKFSLQTIATLPRSERNTLTKDDLEAFAKTYVQFMPEITGKDPKKIQAAAGLFVERFKRCAGDRDVLTILQNQLAQFVESVDAAHVEQHEKAITYFTNKLTELLDLKVTADSLL